MTPLESWRIFGIPKGQPRVRAFVRGDRAGVYDPGQANEWKSCIARAVGGGREAYEGPLFLTIDFYFPLPKRLAREAARYGTPPHASKPDIDNAIKAVMDVLTQLNVWHDDAQVAQIVARKHYTRPTVAPGATILLSRVAPEEETA